MFKIAIARKQPNEKYGLGNDPSPPRGLKEARVRTLIDASSPPRGGWYSHTLPIRVYAAQRGRDFEAPGLERGYTSSNARKLSTFVSSHLKAFKDRLLLKIRFSASTSKPLYSCCTLERSIKNWPISRTGC